MNKSDTLQGHDDIEHARTGTEAVAVASAGVSGGSAENGLTM